MTILDRPRIKVEGAFHTDSDTGANIWDDITSYVDFDVSNLSIAQRRSNLFDERSPGTLSFAVNNTGGEFTDTDDTSPFYPGVTNDTPLRVRIQYPTTANLLPGAVSRTDDTNYWDAQQGSLDTDDTDPATGVSSSVVWATGVLEQTGIKVKVDTGPWSSPGDMPIYVKSGDVYSASIALKADDTISCSLRMAWYDTDGVYQSEETSSTVALTSSWQTLSITNKAAPCDGTLRISIANETTVLPSTRAIDYSGGETVTKQWVKEITLQVPDSANAGDIALVWIRLHNKNAELETPDGWTYKNDWSDARGRTYWYTKVLDTTDIGQNVKWVMTSGHVYFNRILGTIVTYTQVDQTNPINASNESTESSVGTTHTTPNVTTTTTNCWIVSAVFDVSTTNTSWGAPVGETVRQDGYCIKGNACTGIVTDEDGPEASTGTYGSKDFTASVNSRFATMHTVALAPASGTGPDNVNVYIGAPMVVQASSLPSFVEGGDWQSLIVARADSWDDDWQHERAIVTVSATDRSKLLQTITVGAAVSESILELDPIAYYKLDEVSTSTDSSTETTVAADSTSYSQPPLAPVKRGAGEGYNDADPLQFGQGTGPGVDGTSALALAPKTASDGYYLVAENLNTSLGGSEGVSAVLFWRSQSAETGELTIAKICPVTASTNTRTQLEFYGKKSNYIGVKASVSSDGTSFSVDAQYSGSYFDGTTRMLGATLEMVGGQAVLKFYVDGEEVESDTAASTITDIKRMNAIAIGNAYPNFDRCCMGTYSHFALYNSVLTDDDMSNISTAGLTAFANETVNQRLYRILDWEGQTGTDFDTSDIEVDRHMPDDTDLLSALRLVTATDGGTLYIDGNDQIAFRSSAMKQSEYTPVLTLSAGDLAVAPSATKNDELLVNDVTVNREGAGSSQRLVDQDSVTQHGRHDKTVDTLCVSDQEASAMCGYFLAFYSQPITRFDTISIEALLQDDWTDLFTATMWKIIRITDLPTTAPASQLDSHVEGQQWDIGADSWQLTFDVSYAIPFAVLDDTTRGVMGDVVVAR